MRSSPRKRKASFFATAPLDQANTHRIKQLDICHYESSSFFIYRLYFAHLDSRSALWAARKTMMIARLKIILLSCSAFVLAAAGCSRSAEEWVDAPMPEMDLPTLLAMIRDDVSTREASKPGARFAMSSISRENGWLTSTIMDQKSGCLFRITYPLDEAVRQRPAGSSAKKPEPFPGAPGASESVISSTSLDSVLRSPAYVVQARGASCLQHIRRPELARLFNVEQPELDAKKAFAAALPELVAAAKHTSEPDQASRFVLIDSSLDKNSTTHFVLLERSTGCEWRMQNKPKTSLFIPSGISPASCMSALAMREPTHKAPTPTPTPTPTEALP